MHLTPLFFIFVMALFDQIHSLQPIASSSNASLPGHARLMLRSHRRRHRHRANHMETDELFEMLARDMEQTKSRRTKNTMPSKKERNEALCSIERRTTDLNTQHEEFDPPFLVEIRCTNTANYEKGLVDRIVEQKCVHDLLRCVQRYGEVHVSRRPIGSAHWLPHTLRDVPLGCDCMWPVDKYGHQEL